MNFPAVNQHVEAPKGSLMSDLILNPGAHVQSRNVMGEHNKTFSSFRDGLTYLRDHPFGTLEHPGMDLLAFLYIKNDGTFAFVDVHHSQHGKSLRTEIYVDTVLSDEELKAFEEPETWEQSKFQYLQGSEMACRIDGIAWFNDLRADLSLTAIPVITSP